MKKHMTVKFLIITIISNLIYQLIIFGLSKLAIIIININHIDYNGLFISMVYTTILSIHMLQGLLIIFLLKFEEKFSDKMKTGVFLIINGVFYIFLVALPFYMTINKLGSGSLIRRFASYIEMFMYNDILTIGSLMIIFGCISLLSGGNLFRKTRHYNKTKFFIVKITIINILYIIFVCVISSSIREYANIFMSKRIINKLTVTMLLKVIATLVSGGMVIYIIKYLINIFSSTKSGIILLANGLIYLLPSVYPFNKYFYKLIEIPISKIEYSYHYLYYRNDLFITIGNLDIIIYNNLLVVSAIFFLFGIILIAKKDRIL